MLGLADPINYRFIVGHHIRQVQLAVSQNGDVFTQHVNRDLLALGVPLADGVLLAMDIGLTIGSGAQPSQVDEVAVGHSRVSDVYGGNGVVRLEEVADQLPNGRCRMRIHIADHTGEGAFGGERWAAIAFGQDVGGVGRAHGDGADLGVRHHEILDTGDVVHDP
ncbi:hypothetical protein D3C71_1077030 [compost metagenome]